MRRVLALLFIALGISAVISLFVFATRLESWPANLRPAELRRAVDGAVREAVGEALEAAQEAGA